MRTIQLTTTLAIAVLGLVACAASPEPPSSSPPPVIPGTEQGMGVTNKQMADADVVEQLSVARCDRSQSCNRIGAGARYHDRDDCMNQTRAMYSKQLNAAQCPAGIGSVGVSRCIRSIHDGECEDPGQVYPSVSHCKLEEICLR